MKKADAILEEKIEKIKDLADSYGLFAEPVSGYVHLGKMDGTKRSPAVIIYAQNRYRKGKKWFLFDFDRLAFYRDRHYGAVPRLSLDKRSEFLQDLFEIVEMELDSRMASSILC